MPSSASEGISHEVAHGKIAIQVTPPVKGQEVLPVTRATTAPAGTRKEKAPLDPTEELPRLCRTGELDHNNMYTLKELSIGTTTLSSAAFRPSTSKTLRRSVSASTIRFVEPLSLNRHRDLLMQQHTLDTRLEASVLRRGFRAKLLRKYRTILNSWRALDPARHGRCSYTEFCRAVHNAGFMTNVRALWEAMDSDRDGFVSLADIDPKYARLLLPFFESLCKTSGSAQKAWLEFFCNTPTGLSRCTEAHFECAAQECGYTGNVAAVYLALSEGAPGGVMPEDFALLDRWFRHVPKEAWRFGVVQGLRPPAKEALAVSPSRDKTPLGDTRNFIRASLSHASQQ